MPDDNDTLEPDTVEDDDYSESDTTMIVPDSHMGRGTEEEAEDDNGST